MRFFKHFTDMHRSPGAQVLKSKFGMKGYGMYQVLIELCTEQLENRRDRAIGAEDCRFRFNEQVLRQVLQCSRKTLQKFLESSAETSLLSFKISQEFCEIEMPNLLIFLDRDAARSRPGPDRARTRPAKNKEEEIKKKREEESPVFEQPRDLDIYKQAQMRKLGEQLAGRCQLDFQAILAGWPPGRCKSPETALRRLHGQMRTPIDAEAFKAALNNLLDAVDSGSYPAEKVWNLENFIGAEGAARPWLEWKNRAAVDLEEQYQVLVKGVRLFSADSRGAQEWLGAERWAAVEMFGGWDKLRLCPQNIYNKTRLFSCLAQAFQPQQRAN